MKKSFITLAALSILALASCEKKDITTLPDFEKEISFVAELEADATKATLSDELDFSWDADEKIGVWADRPDLSNLYLYSFTNTAEAGPKGTFNGNYRAANVYKCAVFPLESAGQNDSYFFDIPAQHSNYASGKFVSPMIAAIVSGTVDERISYENLKFKHVFGMVKLTVTGLPVGTSSLSWTNLGANPINGKYPLIEANLSGEDILSAVDFASVTNSSKTTTFSFPALTSREDMVFYVPLPAGTYEAGFKIEISDGTNVLELASTSSSQSVVRAKVHKLPTIDASAKEYPAAVGKTYTLSFPDDNNAKNGKSSYTVNWTAIIGTQNWTITNFNNNNWNTWTYIKAGAKKQKNTDPAKESTATIDTQISEAIRTVSYTVGAAVPANNTVSAKLIIASDSGFASVVEELSGGAVSTATDYSFSITTPAENLYYRLQFDMSNNTTKNGSLQINQVVYTTE